MCGCVKLRWWGDWLCEWFWLEFCTNLFSEKPTTVKLMCVCVWILAAVELRKFIIHLPENWLHKFSSFLSWKYEQRVVVMGRNRTGPPVQCWLPNHPCAWWPARPPTGSVTDTLTDASEQNITGPLGRPVIIWLDCCLPYNCHQVCFNSRLSVEPRFPLVFSACLGKEPLAQVF